MCTLAGGDIMDIPGSGKLWNDCAIIFFVQLFKESSLRLNLRELKECFKYLCSKTVEVSSFQVLAAERLHLCVV